MSKLSSSREKRLNNRLLDWIIGGSYLGDYRPNFFRKAKKMTMEAYAHIIIQLERFRKRYRN